MKVNQYAAMNMGKRLDRVLPLLARRRMVPRLPVQSAGVLGLTKAAVAKLCYQSVDHPADYNRRRPIEAIAAVAIR
jgi:hypothetical protein